MLDGACTAAVEGAAVGKVGARALGERSCGRRRRAFSKAHTLASMWGWSPQHHRVLE